MMKPMNVSESREEDAEMSETREPETAAPPVDAAPDVPSDQRTAGDERSAALQAELEKERAAATDYMQRWQRAQADYANFRRRAQQEQEQQQKFYRAQALAIV